MQDDGAQLDAGNSSASFTGRMTVRRVTPIATGIPISALTRRATRAAPASGATETSSASHAAFAKRHARASETPTRTVRNAATAIHTATANGIHGTGAPRSPAASASGAAATRCQ